MSKQHAVYFLSQPADSEHTLNKHTLYLDHQGFESYDTVQLS